MRWWGNEKVVQAFGYQDEAQKRFEEINGRLQGYSLRAIFFSSITNPATRFVNSMVYASVGVAGAFAAIRGLLTVGQLSAFLSYANQYTKPFNEISGVVTELQNALACAARVFELIDEPPFTPEDADAVNLQIVDGSVKLEHVNFSYTPDTSLIEDLNLDVKPGQRIAIVGPTGCGKTTMINLLMRFYDVVSGSIKGIRGGYPSCDEKEPAHQLWYGSAGNLVKGRYHPGRILPMANRTRPRKRLFRQQKRHMRTALLSVCRRAMILSFQKMEALCPRDRSSFCALPASCCACRRC